MCGLAGFVDPHGRISRSPASTVAAMAERLRHRGPDDGGVWYEPGEAALGHRRLSIIDLSPLGQQPMTSQDGRLVMVYNGEIYNFAELRRELEATGVRFRGQSDSEVLLEALARWGVAAALPRLVGMFAIALWDREARELILIRDRLGIKPLYWSPWRGGLLFASELGAFSAVPNWSPRLDRNAVAGFLRHMYVAGPHTVFQDISKLMPGTVLRWRAGQAPRLEAFWDFRAIATRAIGERQPVDPATASTRLEAALRDAVACRMVADVPLGALLSGGIDSSLVTALMQSQSAQQIRTFSIGFTESDYDEAPHARAIAAHLGTRHEELTVTARDALDAVPAMATIYDEPFADASQIPTYLVCRLTRQQVTVVLSGDGGDEVFAGYDRYRYGRSLWRWLRLIPAGLRRGAAALLLRMPEERLNALAGSLPPKLRPRQLGRRAHKALHALADATPDGLYRRLLSHWTEPDALVIGGAEPHGLLWDQSLAGAVPNIVERMQLLDTLTYLPDDILTKVDRASMAVGLEARVPLLDHRVVELAWTLPLEHKLAPGSRGPGKLPLRRILERYVPPELTERPKMGFGVPLDAWLRGPLRDWAESLLDEHRLAQQGLLRPELVRSRWEAHQQGANWAYPLWDVLMLQAWLDSHPVSL